MSDFELPFGGEGEAKDEAKEEATQEYEQEAKEEVGDDATVDDADSEAAEEATSEGGDGDVATPPVESEANVQHASEDAVGDAFVTEENGDEGERDGEGEDESQPGEIGEDVGEENVEVEGEGENVQEAGDDKEVEERVDSEPHEKGEGEHEPEGESAVAEDDGAEGDQGYAEKAAEGEEAANTRPEAGDEREPESAAQEEKAHDEEPSGALAVFAEEDEEEAAEAEAAEAGEDEAEMPAAEDVAEPVQLRMRTKPDDDEFNLDPALDENELPLELEKPSVSSVSFIKAPPIAYEPDRWDFLSSSSATVQTIVVDREKNFERLQILSAERSVLARRNSVLQRKLMNHFKKRKMNDVFKRNVDEATPEMEAKYLKRLSMFGELQASFEAFRCQANDDFAVLTDEETRLADLLQDAIDALVAAERETTVDLLDSKMGKVVSEKLVEKLLARQRGMIKEVGFARFIYIRLKNKVNAKEEAIKALEDLGQNLNMMDYEQLRMENQNLGDKLEERDDELARLRARAVHSAQALTHYKEKMCMVISNLDKQLALLKQKERELEFARSELNSLKATRDRLRADYTRDSAQCGLLTKPQLLRDFEHTLDECEALRAQLGRMQTECAVEKAQLTAVRQAVGRNAAVEVEIKPKKMTYMDRVSHRLGEKQARRTKTAKVAQVLPLAVDDEELFQM